MRAAAEKLVSPAPKLGRDEEMQALKRLDNQARQLERRATGPALEAFMAAERNASSSLGGRSVVGWEEGIEKTSEARSG